MGIIEEIDDKHPEIVRQLFRNMCVKDPNDRITIFDVYG